MSSTSPEAALPRDESSSLGAFCVCLLILVALIDSQVVAAITPPIAVGLGATKAGVASSVTFYSLAAAAAALVLWRASARQLRPAVWLPLAAGVFVAADLVAAVAPRLWVFWAARSLAGLAGGLISALAIAALADASSYARRGRQMSGVAISYFLAPVLGVPVGAFVAGRFGWRAVFVGAAALVALAGVLVRLFPLPATAAATSEGGAPADAATQAAEDATTIRGINPEKATARRSLWRVASQTRSTRMGIVSAFFVSGGLVGLTTYLGAWLADAFRADTQTIGTLYAVAGLGAVAGGALGGWLADKVGKRRVAAAGSLWLALLLLLLPGFDWGARLWVLLGVTAFAAALRIAPLQALITELVPTPERAAYVALRNGASQLGIAFAVAAGARLYPAYGLSGVAALCAALTLGAWLTIRRLAEPHDAARAQVAIDSAVQSSRGRRYARRLARAVLVAALLVVLGLPWLLSFAITKAGTRPGERERTDTPAQFGAPFEDVTFTSSDGNQLSGWYLPANSTAAGAASGKRITIVMTHGLFRSRYEVLERGIGLWRRGYGVLLYDLRRHGQSRAEFSSIGFNERHDVEAAAQFVRGRVPQDQIVLMGVSMGAAATLLAAAEMPDEQLLAVVAESSFLSFEDTARHHVSLSPLPAFPFATLLIKFTAWRLNFAPVDFDVLRAVQQIEPPILFIGGTADQRMPNQTVLEPLLAAARHPLKAKLIVDGARHGRAFDLGDQDSAIGAQARTAYLDAVDNFLQKVSTPRLETDIPLGAYQTLTGTAATALINHRRERFTRI
ncbi:MAG: MFS transporter [Pyrinomonadaceae bacterium]|nr:MFS transporter [Pyrinomonadaceae bacterium]